MAVTTWLSVLPHAAPALSWPPPPPPPVEARLLCLAACANVGQGDRLTLILSLAELESGFLEFSTRGPFLGFICSVSCLLVRHLNCFFFCFSVPFPLVVYFL